ncbi:MAG: hypothetical protein IJ220_00625 [Clostridia bacterium]|nr:hypothetical protein [Clostridia bacterium]
MFRVRVHFVGKEGMSFKDIPLKEIHFERLPHNIAFFTVTNEYDEIRFIFVVRDRANIRERCTVEVEHITVFGEDWSQYISCAKAEAYITSMNVIKIFFKILKDSRSNEFKKLSKRIGGYAKKKNIPRFDYFSYSLKKADYQS